MMVRLSEHYRMKLGDPSLDQLRIFLAVVEHGSFGGAARALGVEPKDCLFVDDRP